MRREKVCPTRKEIDLVVKKPKQKPNSLNKEKERVAKGKDEVTYFMLFSYVHKETEVSYHGLPQVYNNRTVVYPQSKSEFYSWLQESHTTSTGIYLVYSKKSSGYPRISYDDAVCTFTSGCLTICKVCVALCFGWIDSTMKSFNADFCFQLFTPRRKGSTWSALNKTRIEKLVISGEMQKPGKDAIANAKGGPVPYFLTFPADGSWTQLDAAESLVVPPDLAQALENFGCRETWDKFAPSSRKSILFWITSAKREETRFVRVQTTARMASKGLRARFDKE